MQDFVRTHHRQSRWFLLVGAIAVAAFLGISTLVSWRAGQLAFEDAMETARVAAYRHGAELTVPMVEALATARTLAHSLEGMLRQRPHLSRQVVDQMFIRLIETHPFHFGAWAVFLPQRFDGRDAEFAGQAGQAADGGYVPFAYRKNGRVVFQHDNYTYERTQPYFAIPFETGEEAVIDPYVDQMAEKAIMSSLCVPIRENGEAIGVAGIDLLLTDLGQAVAGIVPVPDGYVFLVANNGIVVGHPDPTAINRPLTELGAPPQVLEAIKNGQEIRQLAPHCRNGEPCHVQYVPIRFGRAPTAWSLGVAIPDRFIRERARTVSLGVAQISLASLLLLTVVLGIAYRAVLHPLRQAEATLRRFFDHVHDAVVVHDAEGNILTVNDQMLAMYGLTRADLERFNHVRFLMPPGEDPAHLTEMVTTALRDGKAQRECRIWRPLRQEEFWADIHLRPLLVLDQTVLLATIRDITDRRRAEAEMRRLASIVENSLEFISIATLAGEIIYLNPAGCQMVGLDPAEQGCGHQLAEILEEGWRLRHQAEERQTLRATGRWRGQVTLRHLRSGRHIPMEGTSFIPGFPILDERTVAVSILHDISERLAAEAERIATALRTERQMRCIIRLATSLGRQSQDPARLLRFLTEEIAATLDVDRASLWLATPTMDRLTCVDLYDARGRSHTAGQVLVAAEAPLFFLALQAERAIDAPDAVLDPRTAECAETYLLPNQISSLLAAPIRRSGTVVGVVNGEHRGPPRRWLPDEIRFMGEVADQIAQIMTRMEPLWPPPPPPPPPPPTPPTPPATPPAP